MKRVLSHYGVLVAVALLAAAGSVSAQEFRATIKGQVLDSSQGALPGATVSVQNADTNEVATAITNAEGNYTVPFLRPGLYSLTIDLAGFQKHTRSGLRLEVSEVATINVQLSVGGRIVRINAVPRQRVYGRSLIGPRSPSPTDSATEQRTNQWHLWHTHRIETPTENGRCRVRRPPTDV